MQNKVRRIVLAALAGIVGLVAGVGGVGYAHDADGGGHDQFAHVSGIAKRAGSAREATLMSHVVYSTPKVQLAVPGGTTSTRSASCPEGPWVAIGGGIDTEDPGSTIIRESFPANSGLPVDDLGVDAWATVVENTSGVNVQVFPYVVCIRATNAPTVNFDVGDPTL